MNLTFAIAAGLGSRQLYLVKTFPLYFSLSFILHANQIVDDMIIQTDKNASDIDVENIVNRKVRLSKSMDCDLKRKIYVLLGVPWNFLNAGFVQPALTATFQR